MVVDLSRGHSEDGVDWNQADFGVREGQTWGGDGDDPRGVLSIATSLSLRL